MVLLRCKLAVVGDATVGKTALVATFINGHSAYPKNYVFTAGADVLQKAVKIPDLSTSVELTIFDMGGQSIFNSVVQDCVLTTQMAKANAVIFAYDCTSMESFNSLEMWVKLVREGLRDKAASFFGVVVATKADNQERISVNPADGATFARNHGFEFFETSALKAQDADTPFHFIADVYAKNYERRISELENISR